MTKTALVTGAARGIGAATAEALAAAGYHVLVTDVLAELGRETASKINQNGGRAEFASMDVADTATVNRVIDTAERQHGAFEVIVNNAAFVRPKPLETLTDADWDAVLDANLKGMMRVCRAATPAMKQARCGSIVCLSSIAGHTVGWAGSLAYSSSKAGIAGFVKTLAMELGPFNIRVNGIAPAALHTTADQVPLGRVGTPADIANAVMMLVSPLAGFITGQTINVDGGFSVALFRQDTLKRT